MPQLDDWNLDRPTVANMLGALHHCQNSNTLECSENCKKGAVFQALCGHKKFSSNMRYLLNLVKLASEIQTKLPRVSIAAAMKSIDFDFEQRVLKLNAYERKILNQIFQTDTNIHFNYDRSTPEYSVIVQENSKIITMTSEQDIIYE